MDRGSRIARARGRAHDKLRGVFNHNQCLKVLTGDQQAYATAATYDAFWYLDTKEYLDVVAKKRFKRVVVDDPEGCRLSVLKSATAFQIGDEVFTFHGKDSFLSAIPSYEFKVVHAGPRI